MPCAGANATFTVPVGGCEKTHVKVVGDATITFVAATPLICRSAASTPLTASEKTTATELSCCTVDPAVGVRFTMVGGWSSMVATRVASTTRSLLVELALKSSMQ